MGYGGGGGGGGGSGGSGGGSGSSGGSGYRRVGDDRTANLFVDNITNRDGSGGTEVDGIVEVNSTSHFIPPSGTTAERGSRGRGVFGGGYSSSPNASQQVMDYVTIATLGNAADFGDLTVARSAKSGGASSTRGIFLSGRFYPNNWYNIIDYITISSTGNAFDFGDLHQNNNPAFQGISNQIRSVYAGGYLLPGSSVSDFQKTIGYFTIATKGNASEFGSLTIAGRRPFQGSNGVRAIWGGSRIVSSFYNTIDYVNIMTTGDAKDFGDLTVARANSTGSATSSTRMVMYCGLTPSYTNTMDYITMSSTGNATDFGDAGSGAEASGGTSNSTRGVFQPGTPGNGNTLEYLTIATTGNSSDFGDLSFGRRIYGALSDSHGGLS